MSPAEQNEERSLGELFGELAQQTTTLVRDELRLAKVEMTNKAADAGKKAVLVGAGGIVAHAGLFAILAGIIAALAQAEILPIWTSALLVGFVCVIAGYAMTRRGLTALKNIELTPRETVETLKEDKLWAQRQLR